MVGARQKTALLNSKIWKPGSAMRRAFPSLPPSILPSDQFIPSLTLRCNAIEQLNAAEGNILPAVAQRLAAQSNNRYSRSHKTYSIENIDGATWNYPSDTSNRNYSIQQQAYSIANSRNSITNSLPATRKRSYSPKG